MTGDFSGNIAVWDLEEAEPVDQVTGGHSDMINCVTGDSDHNTVVTGGRDGQVRVWDRRDLRQCVVNIVGDTCRDTWTVTTRDHVICAGYSNGDIRQFDTRAGDKAVTWESNIGTGGVTCLCYMEDRRLCGASTSGMVTVWDMVTWHKTRGYTRTDHVTEKSCVWRVSPSPHDNNVMMTTLSSGSANLVKFKPPGHR